MKFWVMCWNTMETDLNEFRASSNFVVTSCASPAVQENSWSLRVDHRKSLRFGSCYLPNANLVGECWFDPPWKVDSIPVLACTCFFSPRYDFAFWFLKKLQLFFWLKPKLRPWRARHGRAPCGRDWDPWVIPRIWPRHGGNWPKTGASSCVFFCWDAYCRWSWNLWWPQWCTSPTPSGGHGFSCLQIVLKVSLLIFFPATLGGRWKLSSRALATCGGRAAVP